MKSILLAIFVVGMGGLTAIIGNREDRMHKTWGFEHRDCRHTAPCIVGHMVFIDDSLYCPWWIDPELWWNQSCSGGLPPRLPVPEGLR